MTERRTPKEWTINWESDKPIREYAAECAAAGLPFITRSLRYVYEVGDILRYPDGTIGIVQKIATADDIRRYRRALGREEKKIDVMGTYEVRAD